MTMQRTVLVVDDDDDVRESVCDALDDAGYAVESAANGLEALQLLRDRGLRPVVILLDMMMPEMDGWAFRQEQDKDPALALIPVIVFTAHGVGGEAAEDLRAAASLRKPLRLRDLLDAIEKAQEVHRSS
jgi:CheY-like chemotaxis protein